MNSKDIYPPDCDGFTEIVSRYKPEGCPQLVIGKPKGQMSSFEAHHVSYKKVAEGVYRALVCINTKEFEVSLGGSIDGEHRQEGIYLEERDKKDPARIYIEFSGDLDLFHNIDSNVIDIVVMDRNTFF